MVTFSTSTRLGLALGLLLVATISLIFARRQNRAAGLGGAISRPKQLWLAWTIYTWFVVAPTVAADPGLPRPLAWTLGGFAGWMWFRGLAELFMLYVTKNWRPPYGISHDLSCIAWILGAGIYFGPVTEGVAAQWVQALVLVMLASLCLETWYAWAFFRAVEGRTTGHDGVWFADPHDPRFRRINQVTTLANGPLDLFVGAFVVAVFFLS